MFSKYRLRLLEARYTRKRVLASLPPISSEHWLQVILCPKAQHIQNDILQRSAELRIGWARQ